MSLTTNKILKTLISYSITLALFLFLVGSGFLFFCIYMPGETLNSPLPVLSKEQQNVQKRLTEHVRVLAQDIGERNHSKREQLEQAADYIIKELESYGYVPAVRYFGEKQFRNISVDLHGKEKRDEIVVIGAHYDTTWMTPGADDNASGVAGLLEIARMLRQKRFARTIRLIAFTNEEEPYYGTDNMGSRVSAKRSYERRENITTMISLEMIGYYSNEAKSQYYPKVVRQFYPNTGNFIAFVANLTSRQLLHRSLDYFRQTATFPSEGLTAPEWLVPHIRRSDNASYWYYGFPAIMVTDTANFRNWNYHNVADTYDSLDYESMARVVTGLTAMTEQLARE